MKKFDIHCHVTAFPDYCPPRPFDWREPGDHVKNRYLSLEQQIEMHDTQDVAMGVLLCGGSPERIWEIVQNEEAKFLADQRPDRFVWFFNIDPRQGDFNTRTDFSHIFAHYKSLGARGLGEISATLPVDGPLYDNYWRQAAEFDLPVLLHVSPWLKGQYGVFDQMGHPGFDRMLSKHKNLKIIGHSMAWWSEMGADLKFEEKNRYPKGKITEEGAVPKLMRKHENLYCDLSAGSGMNAMMRDPEYAAKFIEEFSDRIMYGIDSSSVLCKHQYEFNDFMTEMLNTGMISRENYAKIMYKNAAKLLHVDEKIFED